MSFNKDSMRVTAVCRSMEQDGYAVDMVETIRYRLLAEGPDNRYLTSLEKYYATGERELRCFCHGVHGVHVSELVIRGHMEYPEAVATLLWIEQEPEEALEALRCSSGGKIGKKST